MQRKYAYLEHRKALLHYSEFGEAKKVALCFHGFGQKNTDFKNLELALKDQYKIYSFDLFYHGESFWHERDTPLSKELWETLMQEFLEKNKIKNFSLIGFSMGAKFTMATMESFPQRVEKIILAAPDGIKTNFWYSLATYPGWIRGFFRSIILKPKLFVRFVNFISFFGLADKGLIRFAKTQMQTREQRRRIYYSWVVFKELKFDLNNIARIIIENNINLEMFLGEYDKIITLKNMQRLLSKLKKSEIKVTVLNAGHSNLIDAVAEYYSTKHTL